MRHIVAIISIALPVVFGQQSLNGQCGGIEWKGPTTCIAGSCCTYGSDLYSQCLPCTNSTGSTAKVASTTTASTAPSGNFTNPVLYEDFADNDIFLGPDGAYYFSASNMHFSPGAPILKSYDLVNWKFIGHSVPTLAFGDSYNMDGDVAYRRGTWASTMRYRASTGLWYWYGCIDFWNSYVYTAPEVTGPWTQAAVFYATCFYDCGLLIDDDDTMYIVYGSNDVSIAQLASDGLSIAKTQKVFSTPPQFSGIEGNRMYKRNGIYYVLDDAPSDSATLIWQSGSVFGNWTEKTMIKNVASPNNLGGTPDQGSLIETPAGEWYFMSFSWVYPLGRVPVLAPITWGTDNFPIFDTVNGAWGDSYPNPLPTHKMPSWTGTDTFPGTTLSVDWEWNHNPDTTKYAVNNGITLSTATVTTDIYKARNTLTHRCHGPLSVAIVVLDTSSMADGDSCGLAAFRDWTAYIGISRSGGTYTIANVQGALQNSTDWSTITDGSTTASAGIAKGKVWLRGTMHTLSNGPHTASFEYSTDGSTFTALGGNYTLNTDWSLFMGYRWGIFNYATKALGGSIGVSSFTLE
ncbi:Uncharacterized protein BP5553_08667 [Venustampulla echinocandica]|uniref:CBM1 domain-containing protein n=1 Tax=Venustampulla echinocandica TaxID=2656787 RepID=A0A370TEW1_9HELO|nr:Uncharacterized protein BP5553_08667 [Venustampulla echinocandica]RDL33228.1 Uncharacterized protein BP5553_08667 [Venustampulla echinocandica]